MLDRLRDFLSGAAAPAPAERPDDLELAVAALLVEAATIDDGMSAAERAIIETLLQRHFHLDASETARLVDHAHEAIADSVQLHGFLRSIRDRLGPEERIRLIEMLWKVAYADHELDPHEDALIRRVADLVAVSDRDRGAARKRVRQRLGLGD